MTVERIVDWLVNGAPGVPPRAPDVFQKMCEDLVAVGVPIDRGEAFVRTLHPHIVGRSFVWQPGKPVEVREQTFAYLASQEFVAGSIGAVFRTGEWQRVTTPERDLVVAPLTFLTGQHHAVSIETRRPGGFDDSHIAAFRRVGPPLARVAEILALARTATNLLDTYVGRNAGARIMAGRIQRGDVEPIHAVLWFSDLRGFTTLAGEVPPNVLIGALNDLFECQVPAIQRHGGEVLKFMGDGLLAIFPIVEGGRPVPELCSAALTAANEAIADLGALNERRAARGEAPMRIGLALHVGDVAYGNIGGAGRLDFTCIGPAVNLASRLEGVAGKLGRTFVVSEAFAQASGRSFEDLGRYEVKGVAEPQRVYGA